MVPLGSEVTAIVTGDAIKSVSCESCNHIYHYRIEREGTGEGFSWFFLGGQEAREEAASRADRDLKRQLRDEANLVPCPRCGHCQFDMVEASRQNQYRWMTGPIMIAAMVFLYALPLSLVGGKIDGRDRIIVGCVAAVTGLLAFGGACVQSLLRKRYDPNSSPLAGRLATSWALCLDDMGQINPKKSAEAGIPADALAEDDAGESVSSADQHVGAWFLWFGGIAGVLGGILLTLLPAEQQWRAIAAFVLAGLFVMFGVKFLTRKT